MLSGVQRVPGVKREAKESCAGIVLPLTPHAGAHCSWMQWGPHTPRRMSHVTQKYRRWHACASLAVLKPAIAEADRD